MQTVVVNDHPQLELPYEGRKATLALNVVIVGCGLGGLSAAYCMAQAGHKVTILESAPVLSQVGAGIQVSPNITRLLIRWGLGPQLQKFAVVPEAVRFRKYNTGDTVGWTQWGDRLEKDYGAPYYHIHRADLLSLLVSLAAPFMTLRLNSRVISVDATPPSVTLQTGEVIFADLVIGADGVKSIVREAVVGGPSKPVYTGDAAYRAVIPTDSMLSDPDLKVLVDTPEFVTWMGPDRHIVGYNISSKKAYNVVVLHPDYGVEDVSTVERNIEDMKKECQGWEPTVRKLLALVTSTSHWRLMDHSPLKTWLHEDGAIALLGDACHPMLPYRAQGAAMAIEDAAVLGNLFSHLSRCSQIRPLLQAYLYLRYPRATETYTASKMNRWILHLDDGPEQEARDASMRLAMEISLREANDELLTEDLSGNANQYADKAKSFIQYAYDADKEVENWWMQQGEILVGAMNGRDGSRL
jgi:salicylate hydroxylase